MNKQEKLSFNKGVNRAINELMKFDGIIPENKDREYLKWHLSKKCLLKSI